MGASCMPCKRSKAARTSAFKHINNIAYKAAKRYGVQTGLARTIYIRCIYGIFGREITKYTVIYGVYIRFWPTLRTNADR